MVLIYLRNTSVIYGTSIMFDREFIEGCVAVILFIIAATTGCIAVLLLTQFLYTVIGPAILIGAAILFYLFYQSFL